MEEDKSLVRDCLELAFGITIVAMAMPFVAIELAIEKVQDFRKLLQQMDVVP